MSIRSMFFAATYDRQIKRMERAGLAELSATTCWPTRPAGCSRWVGGLGPTWPTTAPP